MKKCAAFLLVITSFALYGWALPIFPGAEGWGTTTVGGRGGTIYRVTNTNDSGSGSLRACIEASGARTCVFTVGGLITISTPLTISNPYITIAGQTAPGGGITIKTSAGGDAFSIQTHDIVMRYISVRPGPGGENHAVQIADNGTALYNNVVDHCTFSWGVDSNIETWYRVYDSTISWSLISEGLDCSTHSKGCHSKGLMIGGYAGSEDDDTIGSENISIHHNVMAHNGERNPLMQLCGPAQVINNITYNPYWTFSHQQDNCAVEGDNTVNWVGNYHKRGPDSTSNTDLKMIPESDNGYHGYSHFYVYGNIGPSRTSDSDPQNYWVDTDSRVYIVADPVAAPTVTTTTAANAYGGVLQSVGNSEGIACNGTWYSRRDTIDARIVSDVVNGTGNIIDSPTDVGGWITPATGSACTDTDSDGMPDLWEDAHGLDKNSAADANTDRDSDGYLNIEEWFNGPNRSCDIDGNGSIAAADIDSIIDIVLGRTSSAKGDVNGDGSKNILDVMKLISAVYNNVYCPY